MEKELNDKIIAAKIKIEKLREDLSREVQENKPTLKLSFLTTKELVDNNDPLEAKITQDKIKRELKELNKLINDLWQ